MDLQDLMSSSLLLGLLTLDQINELMLLLMAREERETTASSDEESSSSPRPRGWRPTMSVNDMLSDPLLMSIMTTRQITDLMYIRLMENREREYEGSSSSSSSSSSSERLQREEAQRRRLVRRRPLRSRQSIAARKADFTGTGSGTRPDSEDSSHSEQEGCHLGRAPCGTTQGCKRAASDGEGVPKVAKRLDTTPHCDNGQYEEAREQDVLDVPQLQKTCGQDGRQSGIEEEGKAAGGGADEH
ncbi:uncharacterized protein [Dermacentor andersoni]|uniref:uncharacterized protein isoform X3 n=1 Tax=Dermacentor andersoni TaxID=34620 RepID=UPI002155B099|nr:uncharacterized protein LOC126525663 isoform X3 [Dermacentor andersoni]